MVYNNVIRMPLDPNISELLKIIESNPIPELSDTTINDYRKIAEESPLIKGLEEMKSTEDIELENNGHIIKMRLYTPEDSGKGIIIYFHGGGFVFGSIETHDGICRLAANKSKMKVISVDYRLATENKFPAPLEDAIEALKWVQNNYKKLGIDPDRIAVAGDSAGGNISAGLCLKVRDDKLKLPRLQVLLYPTAGRSNSTLSMSEYSEGFFLTAKDMAYFSKSYLENPPDILNPYLSINSHTDHSGLPDAIIVTAEFDPLRDEGEAYLGKLQRSGVNATGIRAKGMVHGFASFFPIVPASENILTMVWCLAGKILKR